MSVLSSFLQYCTSCWHGVPSDYTRVSKQADDYGVDEANAWIQRNPVNPLASRLSYDKVREYAHQVFKDFKKVPLTSANIEMVGKHLADIAMESDAVRTIFLESLYDFGLNKPFINDLYTVVWRVETDKC